MLVGIDGQIFERQRQGGISRYFTELLTHLNLEEGNPPVVRGWEWSANRYALASGLGRSLDWLPAAHQRISRAANIRARRRLLDCDLIHHTYYDARSLPASGSAAHVTTIYDVIPESLYRHGVVPDYDPRAKAEYIRRCDGVIYISHSTRGAAEAIFGPAPGLTAVIPLAASKTFGPGCGPPAWDCPYILYVGNRSGYKSFETLLNALSSAHVSDDTVLVLAGGEGLAPNEVGMLRRIDWLRRTHHLSNLPDRELARLYAHATLLVSTSVQEGFGLPIVEAMQSGAPVLLTHTPAHQEVAGAAAVYFRPSDARDLARHLERILRDIPFRTSLRRACIRRASLFAWESIAASTLRFYYEVSVRSTMRRLGTMGTSLPSGLSYSNSVSSPLGVHGYRLGGP